MTMLVLAVLPHQDKLIGKLSEINTILYGICDHGRIWESTFSWGPEQVCAYI